MMDRKNFLSLSASLLLLAPFYACKSGKKKVKGKIVGSNAKLGHMLRSGEVGNPKSFSKINTVIVGAGISGLSAGRELFKNGLEDFVVLDLEETAGGNSRTGSNDVSSYPWGAHYIPTPNNDLKEYLTFLQEAGVVTGFGESGLPIYNEYYLCFDPEERLYINGRWQNGIIPEYGLTDKDKNEIRSFLAEMQTHRTAIGEDGKQAFSIPINNSSRDPVFTQLDSLSMKEWMDSKGFKNPYLQWYVNYCTRDDFGSSYEKISAWMGIHYFAGRKGKGVNANPEDVLTWPEGNGFLVNKLSQNFSSKILTGCLVQSVRETEQGVEIIYFDSATSSTKGLIAQNCIMATPQFVAARILADNERKALLDASYHYTPWVVANLKVSKLEERSGAPLSWDNVIYDSKSLGYVQANHNLISQNSGFHNLTYYYPFTSGSVKEERARARNMNFEDFQKQVLNDLKVVHPNIEEALVEMNVLIWGHAMVQPIPGHIFSDLREKLAKSKENIHFAHTDLAGASIFEEGFYQGIKAAQEVLNNRIQNVQL